MVLHPAEVTLLICVAFAFVLLVAASSRNITATGGVVSSTTLLAALCCKVAWFPAVVALSFALAFALALLESVEVHRRLRG